MSEALPTYGSKARESTDVKHVHTMITFWSREAGTLQRLQLN